MEGGTVATQRPTFQSPQQPAQQRFMPRPFRENTATPDQRSTGQNFRQRLDGGVANAQFDGKRMRKAIHRKTVDYNPTVINYLENRVFQRDFRDRRAIQPDALYATHLLPPSALLDKPMNCVTTRFVRTSTNKFRCPIFCLTWTPEGRRLVTGASSGEFTLWNGLTFNFETILQAHDSSVRAMQWSHNDLWMVTADHGGYIKYWQSNMNNVKMYQGHKEAIRGLSFAPTDSKFATCSDDGTVRIWDFMRCQEEKILRGHGADVKCVDWHPQKSLVASGSKDNQQPIKLWDPRTASSLATIHAHKHTVMDLSWNRNGHWLLTASRDHLLKLFDIRNLKAEVQTFKGHKKEATSIAWHPIHESLFATGGSDGSLMFWLVGCDREVGSMEEAHEGMVWSLGWHPLGHILVSGSNDHSTKFWTRNRPGDEMRDRYNLNNLPIGVEQELLEYNQEPQSMPSLPGMGLEHGLPEHLKPKEEIEEYDVPNIPGLDWNSDSPFFKQMDLQRMPQKKIPFARPIPKNFEQAWAGNKSLPSSASEEDKKGVKGSIPVPQQPKMPRSDNKGGNNGGLPMLPPGVSPAAMSLLLSGAAGPTAAIMGMLNQAGNIMQLQQMAMHHQALFMQQALQQKQQNSSQQQQQLPGLAQLQQGIQHQANALSQQQLNPIQQLQLQLGLKQPAGMQISQAIQPPQMQPRPPLQQQNPALQQQQQQMGIRPMMSEGQNQFRQPAPVQGMFRPEGPSQQGKGWGDNGPGPNPNQFRPPGPNQFGQPRPQFPPAQQQMPGQQSQGASALIDHDHRRHVPPGATVPPSSAPQLPLGANMDQDFRRPSGPGADQAASTGDQDFRQGGPVRGPSAFPPKGHGPGPHHQPLPVGGGQFGDNDFRVQQQFYGGGGNDESYTDDDYNDEYGEQYEDYDERVCGSAAGDVDERFSHGRMGRGGSGRGTYRNEGYSGGFSEGMEGGPARERNMMEEEHQGGRKRPWEEGPGARGRGGRGHDPRMRGGFGGEGRGRAIYNGPAGPVDPRQAGMRGYRGFQGGW